MTFTASGWWRRSTRSNIGANLTAGFIKAQQQSIQRTLDEASQRSPSTSTNNFRGKRDIDRLMLIDVSNPLAITLANQAKQTSPDQPLAFGTTNAVDYVFLCQYDPESITETLEPDYFLPTAAVTTTLVQGLLYRWNKPRSIKFQILLNDWGDDSRDQVVYGRNVPDALMWLRTRARADVTMSANIRASFLTEVSGKDTFIVRNRPHEVLLLWHDPFIGVIRRMSVDHRKWAYGPSKQPIRAVVSLDIAEQVFFPEAIQATYSSEEGGAFKRTGTALTPGH